MREAPQLAVNDGDQLVERVAISLAPGVEKRRDLAFRDRDAFLVRQSQSAVIGNTRSRR
jgi:hypothetical protein